MTELQKMIDSEKPTLLEFFATWSAECASMAPVVESLKTEFADAVNFVCLEGEKYSYLLEKFNVTGYPCWFLFRSGTLLWHEYGEKSEAEMRYLLRRAMAVNANSN